MKKIFAIVLAAALFAGTNAFAQISVGGGYVNATNTSVYQNGDNDPVVNKTPFNGFYAGANYTIPIPGVSGLAVTPGLYGSFLFSNKHEDGISAFGYTILPGGTYKSKELALNIPLNVNYSIDIARDSKVFVYAGPLFQYTLSNGTDYASDGSSDYSHTDNLKGNSAKYAPFNIYIGGGVGAEFNKIQVILGYDMSLTNMDIRDNYKLSRGQLRIGFGYAL